MSTGGTRGREALGDLAQDGAQAGQTPAVVTPQANTPYWLLWSTGIAAVVLGAVAFVLWGINGASTLFDMIVALCS
jgi:hypothetical protein